MNRLFRALLGWRMKWFDQALRDWSARLEHLPTTVDGKPNPDAIVILEKSDLLLRTAPQVRMAAVPVWIRRLALVVATVILVHVMFYSFSDNNIWLSVNTRAVSFTLDTDNPTQVLKELSLKRLIVNPVNVFSTDCGGKSSSLTLSGLDHEGGTATIDPTTKMRLNGFELPAGTAIGVSLPEQPSRLKVTLTYPTKLNMKLSGTIDAMPGKRSCEFFASTSDAAVELTMDPDVPELSEPAYGQIPINAVQFDLPHIELARSLSAISSGVLSFTDILDKKYTLERGSRLSIDLRSGTVADLHVSSRDISLLLQGDASRVRLGYRDQQNITPTKLDWLRSKSRNIELWMGLIYVAAMLFGIGLPGIRGAKS